MPDRPTPADAPETEIEITPGMIEAGVVAFCRNGLDIELDELVEKIYLAMASSRFRTIAANSLESSRAMFRTGSAPSNG